MRRTVFGAIALSISLLSTASADFKAGCAVRVVTPNPLLPVSGGVGAGAPTKEKRGELTVRALVLENGGVRVAIVTGDFLGIPATLGNRVRSQVKEIPPENILIAATHSHSAPDLYGFGNRIANRGAAAESRSAKYIESVCTKMAEAIHEAATTLRPARIRITTGEAKGKIAYNYYAPQLYDPRCNVIQCVGEDGKPFVTLVNYATHPEVLGNSQGIVSPDLCGPLYDRIAAQGGGTAIFVNSAQGGMVTADNRDPKGGRDIRTWDECLRIGRLLADEALRIVADAPLQENPPLFCTATTVTFPVDSPLMRSIMKAAPSPGQAAQKEGEVNTQVNLINLGNAQIVTIPGEALPNIGFYLKRKMHGQYNLLFGLTNDAFGYILTKVDWGSFKRYEYCSRTSLGEQTGEILIDALLRLVDRCPKPQALAATKE
jgi:hypothetical protein